MTDLSPGSDGDEREAAREHVEQPPVKLDEDDIRERAEQDDDSTDSLL